MEKKNLTSRRVSTVCSDRPPSASRPPPGSGGRGRRRPRSASAAITSTRPQLTPTAEESAADIPRNGQEKFCARPGRPAPTTSRARPASAAAAGGARPRPAPPRPSRPRPVTATGTRVNGRKGSIHHGQGSAAYKPRRGGGGQQRRRVVSAGSYPSSFQGNTRNSHHSTGTKTGVESANNGWHATDGPAWERDEGDHESTPANQTRGKFVPTGSDFYHEHEDLGTDSEVMQRATEFISKILEAGRNVEGQDIGKLPTSQSQAPDHLLQAPRASTAETCARSSGTAQMNGPKQLETIEHSEARPVRGRRRKRAEKASKILTKTTTGGGATSTQAGTQVSTLVASTAETDVAPQTSSEHRQQPQQENHSNGTLIHMSLSACEFPFPPGGTGQDLPDGRSMRGGENEAFGDETKRPHVGPRPENIREEGLDRPPASDGRRMKPTTKKEAGPSLMTPLAFDVFCSLRPTLLKDSRSKQEGSRPTPTTALRGTEMPNSARAGEPKKSGCPGAAPAAFHVGESRDRTVASTWTSVFGAVCAGAERGRARAEVLKAARRGALRQKRRKRCAAAAAAAAVPRLQQAARDLPADGNSAATPSVGATNDRAVNVGAGEKEGLLATSITLEMSAADSITHGNGDSTGEAMLPLEGQGDAAQLETSPLFRHPLGGGTTRISVNAPRSLQVCPGDRGFSGVPTTTSRHCFSSPRRRRSREEQGAPPHRFFRPSPPRRPATASGGLPCKMPLSGGTEANGRSQTSRKGFAGGLSRDVRPETAWSFFSAGTSKGESGTRWPSGSEKRWGKYHGDETSLL